MSGSKRIIPFLRPYDYDLSITKISEELLGHIQRTVDIYHQTGNDFHIPNNGYAVGAVLDIANRLGVQVKCKRDSRYTQICGQQKSIRGINFRDHAFVVKEKSPNEKQITETPAVQERVSQASQASQDIQIKKEDILTSTRGIKGLLLGTEEYDQVVRHVNNHATKTALVGLAREALIRDDFDGFKKVLEVLLECIQKEVQFTKKFNFELLTTGLFYFDVDNNQAILKMGSRSRWIQYFIGEDQDKTQITQLESRLTRMMMAVQEDLKRAPMIVYLDQQGILTESKLAEFFSGYRLRIAGLSPIDSNLKATNVVHSR